MGKDSKISWTDHTFNTWHGCVEVSPGCTKCYAKTFSERIGHGKRLPTIWGVDAERKPMSEAYWREPIKWNREAERDGVRRRVFCASMADVFEVLPERNVQGRAVQDAARARLWPLIEATPHLDWLLLTKRPQNVAELAPWESSVAASVCYPHQRGRPWPANVWLGVTAEDQRRADARIPILISIPARVRFVSHEPALESVRFPPCGLDWIITGGESGPGARPYDRAWARAIIEHGANYGTAVFVKQMGSNPHDSAFRVDPEPETRLLLRDRKGGDPSEWPPELRVQQWPGVAR